MNKNLKIFTDGAFSPLRKSGGVGIVILNSDNEKLYEYSNKYERTSNNQMELGAVIIALRMIKGPFDSITIYSDSQYVIGCATLGWKRNKNHKLWAEFDKQFDRIKGVCSNITFQHINGHQNDDSFETKWNNYVDNLAVNASKWI